MYQASQALRFLKINKIQLLDVKPSNMLLARNHLLRLTDFGESYHREVCPPSTYLQYSDFHPGFTIPYFAPEVFHKEINYTPAVDVFSFGQVTHEVIF
jgi:serine/threonine protein kinase